MILYRAVFSYFKDLKEAFLSLSASFFTALPYLFGYGENRKEVTEQYPDPVSSRTDEDLPPRTRGLLWNDVERCTGCGHCADICPVNCISLETEVGPTEEKKWVSQFDIDFGLCLFCGLCVEICEPQSLVHTRQFEGAVYELRDLVTPFGRGTVSREQREKWQKMRETSIYE